MAPPSSPPVTTNVVEPRFEKLANRFRQNFEEGWEAQGAAFAAYVDGELVADFWGGYADKSCNRPWQRDTLTTIFSCTKGLGAIVLASFVDNGVIAYADKVTKYWPEYGQNGKEATTILHVLNHEAGLQHLRNADGTPARLNLDEATDLEHVERLIERQTPQWTPGALSMYHPFTYGYLIDGLCRRIDARKRTVGELFHEEIARKHDLDIFIGGTRAEEHRMARLYCYPPLGNVMREFWQKPPPLAMLRVVLAPGSPFACASANFADVSPGFERHNNPDFRRIGMPAVNGVATARSLAKTYELLRTGALVSPELFETLKKPIVVEQIDALIGMPLSKGAGFMYTKSPEGDWQVGHTGAGGQWSFTDPAKKIAVAYITNSMAVSEEGYACKMLKQTLYECL